MQPSLLEAPLWETEPSPYLEPDLQLSNPSLSGAGIIQLPLSRGTFSLNELALIHRVKWQESCCCCCCWHEVESPGAATSPLLGFSLQPEATPAALLPQTLKNILKTTGLGSSKEISTLPPLSQNNQNTKIRLLNSD